MYLRPQARHDTTAAQPATARVRAFHRRLPGYAPTPLVDVPALAPEVGAGRVLVKDESSRLGLPAFKILGASWAVARVLAERFGLAGDLDLDTLRAAVGGTRVVLTTATDGNHGRAVARMARLLGAEADVFVPAFLDEHAADAIAGEGADVHRVPGHYEDAVRTAAEHATQTGALLVQDTAWEGYEQVPAWIVEGYATMLAEVDEHVEPDLVVVPVGVGSLAQTVVEHYRGRAHVVSVEPDTADCFRRSLLAGAPVTVRTGVTTMAGLNCGTPSTLAWPVLRDGLSGAVAVSDREAARAVDDLASHGLSSGPCGAATLAAVRALPLDALGLDRTATVVLLSTEAARPPRA